MLSFTVITDTPARLRDFLIARNVIKEVDDGQGGTSLVGVLPGMEWVRVPNPIQTSPGPPPVYDDRAVFLVKFAHESENEDADGAVIDGEGNSVNQYERTKFGKWVRDNSSIVAAPGNYLINGQPVGNAYKITGQQVWLVRDNPERFGVWQ